jgi:SAM-dependent methyltransferase
VLRHEFSGLRKSGLAVQKLIDCYDFNSYQFLNKFDCVWASHVLEHQLNANAFLGRVCSLVNDGGIIVITVPPLKHEIVGGHVTLWNAGLLLYNLVLAGIDCSSARILQYGYNISVITRANPIRLPELVYDNGDVDRIAEFLSPGLSEPFEGDILRLNW